MNKIVFTHHNSGMGGASISYLDNIRMLILKYEVVALISETCDISIISELNSLNVKIITFSGEFPQFPYHSGSTRVFSRTIWTHWKRIHRVAPQIVKIIKSEDPDVVINNTIVQFVLGAYLKSLQCKKVIFIRETFNEDFVSRCMINSIKRYYDGIIGISPYENQYAQFDKPFCVVADVYQPKNYHTYLCNEYTETSHDNRFEVLFLGGLSLLKGIDVLIGCIPYLEKDIRIVIAGYMKSEVDGTNKFIHPIIVAKLKKAKKEILKYSKRIEFVGFTNDIGALMRKASIIVFPSTKPHQPRPVIEAGYFGKTAVISDFKQTGYYFINGHNVLTFKAGSSKDLAKKINLLYSDREYLQILSSNNQKMTDLHHSFIFEQKKINDFIDSIL